VERGARIAGRRDGDRLMVQCPAHEDGSASLSLRRVSGTVLVHCFAGCWTRDVLAVLGWTLADLFDERRELVRTRRRTVDPRTSRPQVVGLERALLQELPGILLWALEGLDRITRADRITEPQSSQEAVRTLADLVSPVSAFAPASGRGHRRFRDALRASPAAFSASWRALSSFS
jgi:hypothetical protein